jgi:hypothetical protein
MEIDLLKDSPFLSPLLEILSERGASRYEHAGDRTLKDHLIGTWKILSAWNQSDELCLAGLFHSCYSTDAFPYPLFDLSERADLQRLLGRNAEERAFLFCCIDRRDLLRQLTKTKIIKSEGVDGLNFRTGERKRLPRRIVADLLVIEMANAAEQTSDEDGWPGEWVAQVSQLGKLIREIVHPVPQIFDSCTQSLDPEDENRARTLYRQGALILSSDLKQAELSFLQASKSNPWVGEPRLFLGMIALQMERWDEAQIQSDRAIDLLLKWGTSWDKHRSCQSWIGKASQIRHLSQWAKMNAGNPETRSHIENSGSGDEVRPLHRSFR